MDISCVMRSYVQYLKAYDRRESSQEKLGFKLHKNALDKVFTIHVRRLWSSDRRKLKKLSRTVGAHVIPTLI